MSATDIDSINEQAARWHARGAAGPLSAADERRLEEWLARDLAHRLAYAEVAAAGFALEQAMPRARICVAARTAPTQRRWPAWLAGAAAAPLLLVLLLAAPHAWQDWRSDAHTNTGAPSTQNLADGSTLHLDTDSAVALNFTAVGREVELLRGALAVDVVKDPSRPFRVHCAGVDAVAVGTRYVVVRRDTQVEIGVTEGRVAVRAQGSAIPTLVSAGERVVVDSISGAVRQEALPEIAYGWTRGVLSFERAPLAEVVRELDRYLPERVYLRAAGAASTPITATFPVDDPAAALESVARSQGLVVRHVPRVAYLVQDR